MWKADGTYITEKFENKIDGTKEFNWNTFNPEGKVNMDIISNFVGIQAGAVSYYARSTPPKGWLHCDGTVKLQSKYPRLFKAIGYHYSKNNADKQNLITQKKFRLPGFGGAFFRGHDDRAHNDPRRIDKDRTDEYNDPTNFNLQRDDNKSHNHGASSNTEGHKHAYSTSTSSATHNHYSKRNNHLHSDDDNHYQGGSVWGFSSWWPNDKENTSSSGDHTHTYSGTTSSVELTFPINLDGHRETRPPNHSLLVCIKY